MQQLLILVTGQVPDDLRRDLASLDPGALVVLREAPEGEPQALLASCPHLVVLGERAAFCAGQLLASSSSEGEPVPMLSVGADPDADLRLGTGPGRPEVLRLALRLARLHRATRTTADSGSGEHEDPTSGLFQKRLEYEFSRALRYRHSVSLVTLLVDGRDRLATFHGEDALEEFMATLEETLRRGLRDVDLLFRSAREEIAAILPETPAQGATLVADRFLAQTSRLVFKPTGAGMRPSLPLKTTSSIGVADGPREGVSTSEDLLRTARESMGSARSAGGGRVAIHGVRPVEEDRLP